MSASTIASVLYRLRDAEGEIDRRPFRVVRSVDCEGLPRLLNAPHELPRLLE